jgi:acetyl esterase/lipase
MKKTVVVFFLFLIVLGSRAQQYRFKEKKQVYKEVDGHSLEMVMYIPDISPGIKLPALVFFFGGGWVSGDPSHFELQARYLATRGVVVVCPDYRTKNRHNTTPFESVKDARSAMRFLKTNGADFGIDTSRIVAGGGSAGGHLAACTAIVSDVDEETDNPDVSPKPFALVLFNPVVDTGKKGYGQEKLDGREFQISPVHHIKAGLPPVLIMHGKADTTVPYENVVRFKHVMKQEGNECILKGYAKQKHGFFNYRISPKYFEKTLRKTEIFLEKYDLLKGDPWINEYCKTLK